ncbi:MAG: hypothetical protein RIC16_07155 [Rhodospirillales bacterium]
MLNENMRLTVHRKDTFEYFCIDDFIRPDIYRELAESFPLAGFSSLASVGNKYRIVDTDETSDAFRQLIETHPAWRDFYAFSGTSGILTEVDMRVPFLTEIEIFGRKNFELSALPADGGSIFPHPDGSSKVITYVIYMPTAEWDEAWGGGMLCHRHKSAPDADFSAITPGDILWEDVDTLFEATYVPNRLVSFKRTNNSLHSVAPIKGPAGVLRTSITIPFQGRFRSPDEIAGTPLN